MVATPTRPAPPRGGRAKSGIVAAEEAWCESHARLERLCTEHDPREAALLAEMRALVERAETALLTPDGAMRASILLDAAGRIADELLARNALEDRLHQAERAYRATQKGAPVGAND